MIIIKKHWQWIIGIIVVLIIILIGSFFTYKYIDNIEKIKIKNIEISKSIKSNYNQFVVTNKKANIYYCYNKICVEVGTIAEGIELNLAENTATLINPYYYIDGTDYYINYKDVTILDTTIEKDNRHLNYIPYNLNIKTENKTILYNKDNKVIYELNYGVDLPVYINIKDNYGVDFKGQLLYIKDDSEYTIYENKNTDRTNTSGIAVFNYHFFYDPSAGQTCNQSICHTKEQFESHLKYIKENKIFTPTMEELELYIDGKLRLPKSAVITIDDGWSIELAIDMLDEYQINGTIFLITAWYDPIYFKESKYVEYHSHGNDLHNPGACPYGQGGAIKCMERAKLLADLKTSREKLDNTTVFCYPFYEYNNYSIEVLKEAGFTMAFAGGWNRKVTVGSNKFILDRYIVFDNTTLNYFISSIN